MCSKHFYFCILAISSYIFSVCARSTLHKNAIQIEKAKVVEANKKYFSIANLSLNKNEDGTYGLYGNFELKQNIPNTTIVISRMFSFAHDKYELDAETDGKHLCKFLEDEFHDWFTDDYLKRQNMVKYCPILKGSYWLKNYSAKDIPYPSTILWRKTLSELLFYYEEELLLHVKWYATANH